VKNLSRRLKVWLVSEAGFWAIRLIGSTLRWEVQGWEHQLSTKAAGKNVIYAFWHGRIFMGTYFWRNRGIVVMTSQNKDGDYIARTIRRFGYGAARGSSSRGATRAVFELLKLMRRNKDAAFTLDGPRGPRYVAKPGAVWLSSKTGNPILPLHLSAERRWVFSSWDAFQVPKPFSRTLSMIGPPLYVAPDASEEELASALHELQSRLDMMRAYGDSYWSKRAAGHANP
jgi:lysophospholipid acyltransferase (LPLAT)-like uncharacterized protein